MLRILGYQQSINVRKVLWACGEAGLPYHHEPEWGDRSPTSAPEFVAINPKRYVPVLIDGSKVLTESNTIVRYIASSAGRFDLMPADAFERAEVEQFMDWQATDYNFAWRFAFQAIIRGNSAVGTPQQIARSLEAWHQMTALVDGWLSDGRSHLCGALFTVADIVVGLSVNRYFQAAIEHRDLPHARRYLDRLMSRPAAKPYLGGSTN